MTWREIVTDALTEIRVLMAGETPAAEDADLGLRRANRLLDSWNVDGRWIYVISPATYTLSLAQTTYTIGPTGADLTAARPDEIVRANIVLTGPPAVRVPVGIIHDAAGWAAVSVQGISSSIPTMLWYETTYPNGKIHLWPYPDVANGLELYTCGVLAAAASLDADFEFPPGYQEAVTLSLAEALCQPFGKTVTPELAKHARDARLRIFGQNTRIPRIGTDIASSRGTYFNWKTGEVV